MLTDFLAFIRWYLAISLLGALALPLVFKFFRRLPDRGYTCARAFGLLAVSYVFWLLGSLGLWRNDVAGVALAALLVGGAGAVWLGRSGFAELGAWLREQRRVVVAIEIVFLAAFAAMALARAYNPAINGTERPMDLMFVNSILRSDTFPPQDAWLSGYPISYYYFGYFLVAVLTRLTGLAPEVAFNLGLAVVFALAAVGALGVVMNLIAPVKQKTQKAAALLSSSAFLPPSFSPALLGPLLVLVVGNFYGVLALIHDNGLLADLKIPAVRYYFGANDPANQGNSALDPTLVRTTAVDQPGIQVGWVNLWDWLDIKQLEEPLPAKPARTNWDIGGWFYAARVVKDRNLTYTDSGTEAIDEMPAFSFILGDMHPHVLTLPFDLLAIALAFDWLLWALEFAPVSFSLPEVSPKKSRSRGWFSRLKAAMGQLLMRLDAYLTQLRPSAERVFLSALILGALVFANTWDFPFYVFLVGMALAVGLCLHWGWQTFQQHWLFPALMVLAFAVLGLALYLPYLLTAQSQVQGILPNLIYPTRFQQTFVMFGPVLIGVTLFVGWLALRNRAVFHRGAAIWVGGGLVGLLVLMALTLVLGASLKPGTTAFVTQFLAPLGLGEALRLLLQRRLIDSLTTLFPAALIGIIAGLGWGVLRGRPEEQAAGSSQKEEAETQLPNPNFQIPKSEMQNPSVLMALLMTLTGALLLLGPEWLYVHDFFGNRMNTLFKFYYQTWLLWALVSAFGIWCLVQFAGRVGRWVMGSLMSLAVLAGLLYTFPALATNANHFASPPTLDGLVFFAKAYPDDWAAIQWLRRNVSGTPVIAEGSYGQYWMNGPYSRISMATGLPTILGWRGHEEQWRGSKYLTFLGERDRYLCGLYRQGDWPSTQAILDKFTVEYVYVSSLEKNRYRPSNLQKFDQNMQLVYQGGDVKIYQRLAGAPPAPADALPDVSKLCTNLQ